MATLEEFVKRGSAVKFQIEGLRYLGTQLKRQLNNGKSNSS